MKKYFFFSTTFKAEHNIILNNLIFIQDMFKSTEVMSDDEKRKYFKKFRTGERKKIEAYSEEETKQVNILVKLFSNSTCIGGLKLWDLKLSKTKTY